MRCSQTYHGAGNIAGKVKGVAAKFCAETGNEKATYSHCTSHELNLSLSRTSKVLQVVNLVSTMQLLSVFFKYSPKRHRKLENFISQVASNQNIKIKVKPLCETRWVERHTVFEDLRELYGYVLLCLESITLNNDAENRFDPRSVTGASGPTSTYGAHHLFIHFKLAAICMNSQKVSQSSYKVRNCTGL